MSKHENVKEKPFEPKCPYCQKIISYRLLMTVYNNQVYADITFIKRREKVRAKK